jgi:peroxiredoxin
MDSIFVTEFSVRGSQINEDWNEIHAHINPLIIKSALLQFENISYEDFEREHTKINNEIIAYNQEYIRQHPDRLISANLIAGTGSTENMIKYADMISNEVRNSAFATTFERIEMIKERMRIAEASKVGATAPDFTLNDVNGNPVTMSTVKGKLKIIDFWASWCGPCRLNNPALKKLYDEYHSRGLEIIGVSLDHNKANWEKAIEKDGLEWINVSSLKAWDCEVAKMYDVKGVPALYILDKNNRIIATGLRGEQLKAFIQEQLK